MVQPNADIGALLAIVRQAIARVDALGDPASRGPAGTALHAVADRLYTERRRRDGYFPQGLFKEPAWDLLLALFVAREEGRELNLAEAYEAARVNRGAGRTLIRRMEAERLVMLARSNRHSRRRSVRLTDGAVERLTDYLASLV